MMNDKLHVVNTLKAESHGKYDMSCEKWDSSSGKHDPCSGKYDSSSEKHVLCCGKCEQSREADTVNEDFDILEDFDEQIDEVFDIMIENDITCEVKPFNCESVDKTFETHKDEDENKSVGNNFEIHKIEDENELVGNNFELHEFKGETNLLGNNFEIHEVEDETKSVGNDFEVQEIEDETKLVGNNFEIHKVKEDTVDGRADTKSELEQNNDCLNNNMHFRESQMFFKNIISDYNSSRNKNVAAKHSEDMGHSGDFGFSDGVGSSGYIGHLDDVGSSDDIGCSDDVALLGDIDPEMPDRIIVTKQNVDSSDNDQSSDDEVVLIKDEPIKYKYCIDETSDCCKSENNADEGNIISEDPEISMSSQNSLDMFVNAQIPVSGCDRSIMDIPVITRQVAGVNLNTSCPSEFQSSFGTYWNLQTRPIDTQHVPISSNYSSLGLNSTVTDQPLYKKSSAHDRNSFTDSQLNCQLVHSETIRPVSLSANSSSSEIYSTVTDQPLYQKSSSHDKNIFTDSQLTCQLGSSEKVCPVLLSANDRNIFTDSLYNYKLSGFETVQQHNITPDSYSAISIDDALMSLKSDIPVSSTDNDWYSWRCLDQSSLISDNARFSDKYYQQVSATKNKPLQNMLGETRLAKCVKDTLAVNNNQVSAPAGVRRSRKVKDSNSQTVKMSNDCDNWTKLLANKDADKSSSDALHTRVEIIDISTPSKLHSILAVKENNAPSKLHPRLAVKENSTSSKLHPRLAVMENDTPSMFVDLSSTENETNYIMLDGILSLKLEDSEKETYYKNEADEDTALDNNNRNRNEAESANDVNKDGLTQTDRLDDDTAVNIVKTIEHVKMKDDLAQIDHFNADDNAVNLDKTFEHTKTTDEADDVTNDQYNISEGLNRDQLDIESILRHVALCSEDENEENGHVTISSGEETEGITHAPICSNEELKEIRPLTLRGYEELKENRPQTLNNDGDWQPIIRPVNISSHEELKGIRGVPINSQEESEGIGPVAISLNGETKGIRPVSISSDEEESEAIRHLCLNINANLKDDGMRLGTGTDDERKADRGVALSLDDIDDGLRHDTSTNAGKAITGVDLDSDDNEISGITCVTISSENESESDDVADVNDSVFDEVQRVTVIDMSKKTANVAEVNESVFDEVQRVTVNDMSKKTANVAEVNESVFDKVQRETVGDVIGDDVDNMSKKSLKTENGAEVNNSVFDEIEHETVGEIIGNDVGDMSKNSETEKCGEHSKKMYGGIRYKIVKKCMVERCFGFSMQTVMLRVKERKTYTDHEIDDDDIEGKRNYKIEEKLASDKYNKDYVKKLKGEEFNLRYLQENGLQYPIIFVERSGLGLRVPSDNFKVSDVKACVGSRRMLDVMDVNTQKGLEMTMKEWVKYYEETNRDRLLNVISLEFSHTKLENYVESPNLVREVDWVDTAWPQHLKDCQTESTNAIDKMKYPKVQKYCLMSVAGCYTDFHIDFGGTSVWYHILHGEKVFWLIPPTDKNLQKYEHWVLSGKQGDAFLADSIEECQMLHLVAGNTFIIPSGWIHAVYTPKDSLVFGGNFLHSFNMVNQLKVAGIEDKTHVPMKFRYPFYAEINWYVLERYVHSLTGVTYLEKPQLNDDLEVISTKMESGFDVMEEKLNKRLSVSLTRIDDTSPRRKSSSDDDSVASGPTRSPGQASTQRRTGRKSSSESSNSLDLKAVEKTDSPKVPYRSPVKRKTKYVHLTKYELEGLIEVVAWVESLPASKKGIPKDLIDPDTVISEVKRLIQEHMRDNPELAITGDPVLEWTKATKKLIKLKQKVKTAKLLGTHCTPKVKTAGGKTASGNRHRRVRCKRCEPCTRDDCMECNFCKDMRKYGGPGRAKQSCISRQCLAPILPKGISCLLCNMTMCPVEKPVKTDGASDDDAEEFSTSLMECGLCWEIVHPACLQRNNEIYKNEGILNEDLPNSWKCSKCCSAGKEGKLVTRVFKGGWRPNTASTPPPLSVSPPPQPQSPVGDMDVMVTEGKRVTVNQALESKHEMMPKLSPGIGYSDADIKPVKFEPDYDPVFTNTKPLVFRCEETVKLEPADMAGVKSSVKRSSTPLLEEPAKKKRTISPVPSKVAKSSKMDATSHSQKSAQKKSQKSSTPEVFTKRSKRETTSRNVGRCTFDFDEEEYMDVSVPLPEKSKGKSPKGKKNVNIKQKSLGATFSNSSHIGKANGNGLELKKDETSVVVKKPSEKMSSDQLKKTLIEHIEKRNLPIIKPQFAVRPAPMSPPDDFFIMQNGRKHPLPRKLWMKVFAFLWSADLARCQAVCRVWNRWCINPDLWKKIDLSKHRIVQAHLMGIVRRQPEFLNLSSVIMTQKQILWLLERIPLLKTLVVAKCSWATISGLCMSSCPLLYKLDVSWATGLNDKCFEDLITPPVDRKPAVKNISRLHRLKSLHLAGTEVTDASLELMTIHLSQLEELNISYCTRIMDRGIKMLASSKSATQDSLKCLNISGCRGLTEVSIEAIRNLSSLEELYAVNCIRIPIERCKALRMQRLKSFKF